jgi:hypothetical protein
MNIFRKIIIILFVLLGINSYAQTVQRDTVLTTDICFYVNTNTIVKDDPGFKIYTNEILPFIYENINSLEKIKFKGAASIEGTPSLNFRLSQIRIEKILENSWYLPSDKVDMDYRGEDYDRMIELITDPEKKAKVREIVNSGVFVKSKIRNLPFYNEIAKEIYPKLRSVHVEAYFKFDDCKCKCKPDTVYQERVDTVYITEYEYEIDTVYIRERPKLIPILAVKTNLAADLIATPNAQAELYTHLWGLSLEFDYTFPWWHKDYDTYFYYQLLDGKAGIRKYLNNQYNGHWFGVYVNTAIYDFCFWNKDKGWQGEVYGAGLGYGYVFQNKKYPRIKFEPYIRVGWFNTKFDTYHASQPWDERYYYNWYLRASDFVPRRFNMNYFGPTEIGFNFTFDLICIRRYEDSK